MIAPGNFRDVLAGTRVGGVSTMPPALYIHMPHDAGGWGSGRAAVVHTPALLSLAAPQCAPWAAARSISTHVPQPAGMVAKVAENVAALRENGTPVGEIRVLPSPVGPAFFSNCSPLIPPTLSALLHAQLRKGRFINATNHIIGGWAGLRCSGLSMRVA